MVDLSEGDPPKEAGLLSSWKEIAAYLGVNVRTAQKWEAERGLPVRRLPGGRSRVLSSIAEIEAWFKAEPSIAIAAPRQTAGWVRSHPLLASACVFAAVCILAGGLLLGKHGAEPAGWRVFNNTLIVSDLEGRTLWTKPFASALQDYARLRAQHHELGWIGDLDGDGRREVVFLLDSVSPAGPAGVLCYDASGNELWRFTPGKRIVTPTETFDPPFRPLSVTAIRTRAGLRLAVASMHHTYYPSQIALLSPKGELLREYWHSGSIPRLLANESAGRPRLLAAGIANGYKQAVLVTLDPETMGGVSVEADKDYQMEGPPAVEVARVLFPRSCINLARMPFNGVLDLQLTSEGFVIAADEEPGLNSPIMYHFGRQGQFLRTSMTSRFVGRHRELETTGILKHPLDEDAEAVALAKLTWLTGGPGAR